jgi:hypothetical protein
MLFEIHLHADSVAADIMQSSNHESELEVLIAAYTTFRVDKIDSFHVKNDESGFDIPLVKLSYVSSWFDFAFDC